MSGRALIVFGDSTGLWWLRWLRPGFRHCFVAAECRLGWVVIDPAAHGVGLSVLPPMSADELGAWYRQHDLTVVECRIAPRIKRKFPLAPLTCVELAKRVVGIRTPLVVTPWQLFRSITAHRKLSVDTRDRTAYIQNICSQNDGISRRNATGNRDILKSL